MPGFSGRNGSQKHADSRKSLKTPTMKALGFKKILNKDALESQGKLDGSHGSFQAGFEGPRLRECWSALKPTSSTPNGTGADVASKLRQLKRDVT